MDTVAQEARPRAFFPDYVDRAPEARTPGWDVGLERKLNDGRTLARGLAWFSIGLGLVEVLAPKKITEFLGVDDRHMTLVRLYGVREIASGVGILSGRTPTLGVWSRVAGDALDMATLGLAFTTDDPQQKRVIAAMTLVAGAAVADITAGRQLLRLPSDNAARRDRNGQRQQRRRRQLEQQPPRYAEQKQRSRKYAEQVHESGRYVQ